MCSVPFNATLSGPYSTLSVQGSTGSPRTDFQQRIERPCPAGKLWSKNGIHFILRNEVYTGTLLWGANAKAAPVWIDKAFPTIVSKAQFRRVNKLMRSTARTPRAASSPTTSAGRS